MRRPGATLSGARARARQPRPAPPQERARCQPLLERVSLAAFCFVRVACSGCAPSALEIENIRIAYVFYESGLSINVMYIVDDPE